AIRLARIEQDRVQAHSTGARLPKIAFGRPQAGKFLPAFPAVRRAEEGGIFRSRIDGIGTSERWFEMPDSFELPGMLGAIVPLVSAGDAIVDEFVPNRFPGFATIVGALHHLSEPTTGLRCIKPV